MSGHLTGAHPCFVANGDLITVYALDMIGFGRSSRPKVQFKTPEQAEDFFLDHFEAWREAMHLDRFTLLGGYVL